MGSQDQSELVGGIRRSRWFTRCEHPVPILGIGFTLLLSTVMVCVGLTLWVAVSLIPNGDRDPLRIVMWFWWVVGVVTVMAMCVRESMRPKAVGSDSLVVVRVRLIGITTGSSKGVITFEGPWMTFEGDRFRFRIAARDVARMQGVTLHLQSSEGVPETSIRIRHESADANNLRPYFRGLKSWLSSAEPSDESLYPPVRSGWLPVSLRSMARMVFVPTCVVTGWAGLLALFVEPWQTKIALVFVPIFEVWLIFLSVSLESFRLDRWDCKIDRAMRRELPTKAQ